MPKQESFSAIEAALKVVHAYEAQNSISQINPQDFKNFLEEKYYLTLDSGLPFEAGVYSGSLIRGREFFKNYAKLEKLDENLENLVIDRAKVFCVYDLNLIKRSPSNPDPTSVKKYALDGFSDGFKDAQISQHFHAHFDVNQILDLYIKTYSQHFDHLINQNYLNN